MIFQTFGKKNSARLSQPPFMCRGKKLSKTNFLKNFHFSIFGEFSEIFWTFDKKSSTGLSKLNSTFPEIFEEIFVKKNTTFHHLSKLSEISSNLCRKVFGRLIKTAIDVSRGKFLGSS